MPNRAMPPHTLFALNDGLCRRHATDLGCSAMNPNPLIASLPNPTHRLPNDC